MTKASADADKFGATERCVHQEPGMLAWLSLVSRNCTKFRLYPSFEFAFRLEPIAQFAALVVRRVRHRFRMRDV